MYGPAMSIGSAHDGQTQHRGLGSRLLDAAKQISREAGFRRISVIAATGSTRILCRARLRSRRTVYDRRFIDGESIVLAGSLSAIRSMTCCATSSLLISGNVSVVPSSASTVTRSVSTAKPASDALTSLATISDSPFFSSLPCALRSRSSVSAAKPTTTGG